MFFLGEQVSASELLRLGAIRAVVPRQELDQTARDLARQLASKSPIALRLAKESMNRVEDLPLKEGYRTEQEYTARLQGFDDAREARRQYQRFPRFDKVDAHLREVDSIHRPPSPRRSRKVARWR